jgi:Ca-activated chloride channel family protein
MAVYKLEDLARRAGVSPRTVRYYVQRGLVPAPAFRGPDTAYGEEHLATLLAVKRLQEDFWPLDAIAGAIAGRSIDELHRIGEGKLQPRRPGAQSAPNAPNAPSEPEVTPKKRKAAKESAREEATPIARAKGERIELARGLELWIDETASDATKALVDEIMRLAREQRTHKESGR